ncbi:hypothetical protein [Aquifex aeolicus]|uniref:hypothetical protein n=1 Tax=Aquifex aeolicus TaxID=63363 RepID=UPI0002EC1611|nr:hypothetical protein [Aquifex aeolicus]
MAQGDTPDKKRLFIKRAREFAYAFIGGYTLLLIGAFILYPYFKMPVVEKLVYYVYTAEIISGAISYLIAFLIRKFFLPVKAQGEYWGYIAMRRYFWSYFLLTTPYFIGYAFFVFAGHIQSVLLGYAISTLGVLLFLPREGDVV